MGSMSVHGLEPQIYGSLRPIGKVLDNVWVIEKGLAGGAVVAIVGAHGGKPVGDAIGDILILDALDGSANASCTSLLEAKERRNKRTAIYTTIPRGQVAPISPLLRQPKLKADAGPC